MSLAKGLQGVARILGLSAGTRTKREIIINVERLETRVAVLEDGKLEELQIEHPTETRIVGSIYKGRIQNLENDLQAAFVDIGLKKNAFLHYWDMLPDDASHLDTEEEPRRRGTGRKDQSLSEEIARRFPPGSEIVVQVTKGPIGSKGPRVTANLSLPGRYLVLLPGSNLKGVSRKISDQEERQRLRKVLDRLKPPPGTGLIVRTAGAEARKTSFVRDLRSLTNVWLEVQKAIQEKPAPACVYQEPDLVERVVRDWLTEDVDRIVVDSRESFDRIREVARTVSRRARSRIQLYEGDAPIFDHFGIERQIEEAFRRKVELNCGGYIVLDETEALVAVDVNTGRYKGSGSQEEAILQVNLEAVEEVARQLRLRNIGGLVIIDLIDMKSKRHQNAVYRAMRAAL
ncbi:MAG: Rne/Rng family ribonuclease, partial [Kiritimatiellae bacterium]|nr:Rne/Rng family ribonuclease [Kiritimatiellia bacterium]